MSDRSTRFLENDQAVRAWRPRCPIDRRFVSERIRLLVARDHCSPAAINWLAKDHEAGVERIAVAKAADTTAGSFPAIELRNLTYLEDGAALSLSIDLDRRTKALIAYTVGIRGKHNGMPWYARIDLSADPEGTGCCGHPLLHCHLGTDPDERFSPRCPLPCLSPWEALDWLLATVDPRLEPEPSESGPAA